MDLVQQLLLAGGKDHLPARAIDLGDDKAAVGADFSDRKSEPAESGHVLHAGIGEIAAGDLPRAFQQMAGSACRVPAQLQSSSDQPEFVRQQGPQE